MAPDDHLEQEYEDRFAGYQEDAYDDWINAHE